MSASLAESALRVRLSNASRRDDPLEHWHFAVPRLRDVFRMFVGDDHIDEAHLRACNNGTKTETAAAYVLSCLQKRRELDGVELPQWTGPVSALCGVLDYKQMLLSVQPAYLRLLGNCPHHARYTGEVLSSIHVQPIGGGSDESQWSVIHFLSQENRRSGVGARADLVHFDEPPVIEILRELRKAAHANRPGIRIIGETPTLKRQWLPLREEYGDTPRSSITRINKYWAECRWSLHEVADWVISAEDKERKLINYGRDRIGRDGKPRPDPLYDARVYGDYVNASGSCPFDEVGLENLLELCVEPDVREWHVRREVNGEEGRIYTQDVVPVEVFADARPGRKYYIDIDPSSGIDSPEHDPGGLEVTEEGSGETMVVYDGYLGSYGLGILGAGLARQYNNSAVDPETNGGWGEGVLRGLADQGYGNISRQKRELSPGRWHTDFGFKTTVESRNAMIAAGQAWTESWREGKGYGKCPSRRVIAQFMDTVVTTEGKVEAGPGYHDEHVILRCQALRKCIIGQPDPNLARALSQPRPRHVETFEDLMAKATQRRSSGRVGGGYVQRPKSRPRG